MFVRKLTLNAAFLASRRTQVPGAESQPMRVWPQCLCDAYAMEPDNNSSAVKPCPICNGSMRLLTRVEHDDKSTTVYWRFPTCSHILIDRKSS